MQSSRALKQFIVSIAAVFLALGFAIYGWSSIRNQFVTLDDNYLIYENEQTLKSSLTSLHTIFTTYDPELYVPVTFLSLQANYLVGGLKPAVYHITSLLLHIACAIGTALFAYCLTKRRSVGWIAGLLFLLHPVQVEAVSWAAARKDVLSTFFLIVTLLAYLRYQKSHAIADMMLVTLLSLLAMLSKPTTIILPFLLLALDWYIQRPYDKRIVFEKAPLFGIALGLGIIAVNGKSGGWIGLHFIDIVLMMFKSTALSVWHVLWPLHLSVFYLQPPQLISIRSFSFQLSIIFVVLIIVLILITARRSRTVSFAALFFVLTFVSSLISFYRNEYYLTSDRYLYVPMIAVCLLAATAVVKLLSLVGSTWIQRLIIAGTSVVLVFFSGFSVRQSLVWQDGITLFSHALSLYPDSWIAHQNRAGAYLLEGNTSAAIEDLIAAARIRPDVWFIHATLGSVYESVSDFRKAEESYAQALKVAMDEEIAQQLATRIDFVKNQEVRSENKAAVQ